MHNDTADVTRTTQEYYNSADADRFYSLVWGGEDIHIGIYHNQEDSIFDASRRTVEKMSTLIRGHNKGATILDIGSGYGGSARYLAKNFGYRVNCLNLSEQQNTRNKKLNKEQQLDDLVTVVDGSFEALPFPGTTFDIVWSGDAILHSGNKEKVIEDVYRVLKKQGEFIFTDPMQSDDCPPGVLEPVLKRIHLKSMGSFRFYRNILLNAGFEEVQIINLSENLITHYSMVLKELEKRREEIITSIGTEYLDRMQEGLKHWIDAGKNGYLAWGILHFRKK
ncbi:MAG: methyltransferase domain-containing protein [Candidatus Brocadiaceae bacterium]|nr:methyltransferase domain-containing protein [Candidatus Brocadiaceae bacterium]